MRGTRIRSTIKNRGLILIMAAVLNVGFVNAKDWQKSSTGILEPEINYVLTDPQDPNLIYLGTPKAFYISKDQGRHYQPAAQIPGSEKGINFIYKPSAERTVYVATDSGVYASDNQGKSWRNIFNPSDPKARRCFSILKQGDDFYVGTLDGLYHKYPNSPTWQRERGDLGNTPIYKILADAQYTYFANERRLFRWNKSNELKIIFEANLRQNEEEIEANGEIVLPTRHIRDVIVGPDYLFIASNDGISFSLDQGQTWNALPVIGLPVSAITSLAVAETSKDDTSGADKFSRAIIYAGTSKGVYQFSENRWIPLYKGMDENSVQALTLNNQGILCAATDSGLFFMHGEKALADESHPEAQDHHPEADERHPEARRAEGSSGSFAELRSAQDDKLGAGAQDDKLGNVAQDDSLNFNNEPTIQEVQRLAIEYAEVDPEKIKQWRRGAKYRAILPTFSAGLDRDAAEYFHWDSGPNPDNLLKGRDYMDWDLTFSWNLGDLIWNPDQTSIDSRSKLMVELREDIMDQVTRLYFERRRVAMEMRLEPATDAPTQLDQELRMAELTALIDALTGGKFSERIEKWQEQKIF